MRAWRLAGALMLLPAACTGGGEGSEARSLVVVYYYNGDALEPVTREVHPGEGLDAAARSLLEPAPGELTSALSRVVISDVEVDGNTITVEVERGFAEGPEDDVARRSAQVVYGLTASEPEALVAFRADEAPLEVITGDGSATALPVGRADYRRFRPWVELLRPTSGDGLATHSITIEAALRTAVDVKVRLEASGHKYFDVVRSGSGIVSVPADVVLVGAGTLTVTALLDGVERSHQIPVTFHPRP